MTVNDAGEKIPLALPAPGTAEPGRLLITWETGDDTYTWDIPRCTGVGVEATREIESWAAAYTSLSAVTHVPILGLAFTVEIDHRPGDPHACTFTRKTKKAEGKP